MTTPKDPTPAPEAPAPESPAPAPKKPAAKKSAPADSKVSGVKPTATATKPAAKKTAKPATDSSPPAPKTTPKTTTGKNAVAAGAKPVARKPRASAAIPEATRPTANTAAEVIAAPADPIKTAPTNGADKTNLNATKILKRAAKSSKKSGLVAKIEQKAPLYWRLMRMDRPIGTLLLLWPTLWSLWIAAKGVPSLKNLVIFVLGVIVMRAAGCVINDFADRKIDGRVERTKHRPLATGAVSSREALGLFIALCLIAFTLVLFTDHFTIKLSVGGLILAFCYPFMKRHTHLPQLVLGAAFAWGIPMAYAAEAGELPQSIWLIYLAVVLWTVVYDTFYAMVDRDDDLKIGVKSTAILFGEQDRIITGALQVMTIYALILVGNRFELGGFYYVGLAVAAGLFIYQQWLIRFRAREACFKAFLNNNWVGVAVFAGLVLDYSFR